jgi:Bardet-Biedl syndrome 1 protein
MNGEKDAPVEISNSQKQSAQWLNAWHDPVANVKAYSNCIGLADLNTDGDHKLLIADLDRKLKVFKGN